MQNKSFVLSQCYAVTAVSLFVTKESLAVARSRSHRLDSELRPASALTSGTLIPYDIIYDSDLTLSFTGTVSDIICDII